MSDREQRLDEFARCYMRAALDELLAEETPDTAKPSPSRLGFASTSTQEQDNLDEPTRSRRLPHTTT